MAFRVSTVINQVWIKQISDREENENNFAYALSEGLSVGLLYQKISCEGDNLYSTFFRDVIFKGPNA